MKTQFVLIALLTTVLMGCNALNSALTVQPGKQFELGGNRNEAFTVRAQNIGDVPVTLTERRANGQTVALGTFAPGGQQTIRFSAGSAALIDNPSTKPAQLRLTVTGDTDLSMRERNPQTP